MVILQELNRKVLMKHSRMYALDGARGFAAFCILLFHVCGNQVDVFANLYIAVDFFFVLSGFVLAVSVSRIRNAKDALTFLVCRFVRIFPMVLAVSLFTAVYDLVVMAKHWFFGEPATNPIILSIPTLLFSLLMLQIFYFPSILVNYPVWSLSAEWVTNILVIITQVVTLRSKYIWLATGGALIVISAEYGSELLNQLGRALWGFSCGLIAFSLRNQFLKYRQCIFLMCFLMLAVYMAATDLGRYQSLFSVWPFAACILILGKSTVPTKRSKLFFLAGKYSYGFYLWHFPLLGFSGFILNQPIFDSISNSRPIMEVTFTSVLSVIATKFSLIFIEDPIRGYWVNKSRMV